MFFSIFWKIFSFSCNIFTFSNFGTFRNEKYRTMKNGLVFITLNSMCLYYAHVNLQFALKNFQNDFHLTRFTLMFLLNSSMFPIINTLTIGFIQVKNSQEISKLMRQIEVLMCQLVKRKVAKKIERKTLGFFVIWNIQLVSLNIFEFKPNDAFNFFVSMYPFWFLITLNNFINFSIERIHAILSIINENFSKTFSDPRKFSKTAIIYREVRKCVDEFNKSLGTQISLLITELILLIFMNVRNLFL